MNNVGHDGLKESQEVLKLEENQASNADRLVLSVLRAEQAVDAWPILSRIFEKSIMYTSGRVELEDILEAIRAEQSLCLAIWNPSTNQVYAALLVQADQYPRKRVFNVTSCAGRDMKEWKHLWPALCQVARDLGFDQIKVSGRAGWKKIMPGARETGRTFTMELNRG